MSFYKLTLRELLGSTCMQGPCSSSRAPGPTEKHRVEKRLCPRTPDFWNAMTALPRRASEFRHAKIDADRRKRPLRFLRQAFTQGIHKFYTRT